jgi:hypothetical protein
MFTRRLEAQNKLKRRTHYLPYLIPGVSVSFLVYQITLNLKENTVRCMIITVYDKTRRRISWRPYQQVLPRVTKKSLIQGSPDSDKSGYLTTTTRNPVLALSTGRITACRRGLPSFFLLLVRFSFRVCGSGHAGNTTLRRTTSNTVFPLSRNTCTAVAYSTFSRDNPLALIIRSFTLQTHITPFICLYCEDTCHIK